MGTGHSPHSSSTGAPPPTGPTNAREEKEPSQLVSTVRTLVVILIAALFLRASVVEAFKIPSASMVPTLKIGDHIFVSKLSYGLRLPMVQKMLWRYATPKRGDIVVFTRQDDPTTDENEAGTNIIKRVIGLPGETIEVRETTVYIGGKAIEEPYARWEDGGIPEGYFGPAVVPEGHIFLLGDNRDRSKDSRFWTDSHYLPLENVKGRALIIYWSWDALSRIGTIIQ